eukprot:c13852_g1_i2 orf=264-1799(+)
MGIEDSLTDYERRRLENVKRNQAMLASLGVQQTSEDLRSTQREKEKPKGYKSSQQKRPRDEPVVLRRSLRALGLSPDGEARRAMERQLNDDTPIEYVQSVHHNRASSNRLRKSFDFSVDTENMLDPSSVEGPLPFSSVHLARKESSNLEFLDRLRILVDEMPISDSMGKRRISSHNMIVHGVGESQVVDPSSLTLKEQDVARVVPERIFNVLFFPFRERIILAVGDRVGNLGLWDVECEKLEGDGVHIYRPHAAPVTGMAIAPYNGSKVLSCSYDGTVRHMDIESVRFDLIYCTEKALSAICFIPGNPHCAYLAEAGAVKVLDFRDGNRNNGFELHDRKINTIDFHPERSHLMATSSTDGTACVWDVRYMGIHRRSLAKVTHLKAVHSAYFSPSGSHLATCSSDNSIGLMGNLSQYKGTGSFEDESMIFHYNVTNRWICSFRAIWGWDDNYIYVANMNRSIDVISTSSRMLTSQLSDSLMTSIPCRLASHPLVEGMLAGSTGGGRVYLWRK